MGMKGTCFSNTPMLLCVGELKAAEQRGATSPANRGYKTLTPTCSAARGGRLCLEQPNLYPLRDGKALQRHEHFSNNVLWKAQGHAVSSQCNNLLPPGPHTNYSAAHQGALSSPSTKAAGPLQHSGHTLIFSIFIEIDFCFFNFQQLPALVLYSFGVAVSLSPGEEQEGPCSPSAGLPGCNFEFSGSPNADWFVSEHHRASVPQPSLSRVKQAALGYRKEAFSSLLFLRVLRDEVLPYELICADFMVLKY